MADAPQLPEWADEWRDGTCSCGGRLVMVVAYNGLQCIACSVSGLGVERECDGGKERAEYEEYGSEADQQRVERPS